MRERVLPRVAFVPIIVVVLIFLILLGYKVFARQIVTGYQGIQLTLEGLYLRGVEDGNYRKVDTIISSGNIPAGWHAKFGLSSMEVAPPESWSGLWKQGTFFANIEQMWFVDQVGRVGTAPTSVASYRWEVPKKDDPSKKLTFVMDLFHLRAYFNVSIGELPESFGHSYWVSYYSPTLWIKAVPFRPTYFTENPNAVYFGIANAEVYEADRVEPTKDQADAISSCGTIVTTKGTDLSLFPEMIKSGGWNPSTNGILANVDLDGDGKPDVELDPTVFKNYWYIPVEWNQLRSHSWNYLVSSGHWRESWHVGIDYWVFCVGKWEVAKTYNVELQPHEVQERFWTILDTISRWMSKLVDFIKSPFGFLILLLLLLVGAVILIILIPPLGTCCGAMASVSAGGVRKKRRARAKRVLDNLRLFRDFRMKTSLVGRFFIKVYYDFVSPLVVALIRIFRKPFAVIVWKFVSGYERFIRGRGII